MLVVGASGQIGGALLNEAIKSDHQVLGTRFKQNFDEPNFVSLDLSNANNIKEVFESFKPDVVYACAALANVDYCETHPEESFSTNYDSVKKLVDISNQSNSRFIFLSTDYVFNGQEGPYPEDADPDPINVYGKHKLMAEEYILEHAKNFLIVRTTITFGNERQGKNFYLVLKSKLSSGQEMRVPTDQFGSPSYNKSIAKALLELGPHDLQDVLNISSDTFISRYDFALLIAQVFELDNKLIIPVTTPELNQAAVRPMKAGLLIEKAKSILKTKLLSAQEALLDLKNSN